MKRLLFDDPVDCAGCGLCSIVCPKKCIALKKDDLGFTIPYYADNSDCIECGYCSRVCPQQSNKQNEFLPTTVLYGQSKNETELSESASGGVFSLLARHVLSLGGVVWGVAMSPIGEAFFTCISNIEDLSKLRGSKYVEVKRPLDYQKIREQLQTGLWVLVSGTPCQVSALNNYLKIKYDRLILVDLLCYGIQSPQMWQSYLKEVAHGRLIKKISMRKKSESWENYSMEILFNDGTSYKCSRWYDPWLLTYSKSIFNRASCSRCQSKKFPHISDFTIGDFWVYDEYKGHIEMDKNKGISVIYLHSNKARMIFDYVKDYLVFDKLSEDITKTLHVPYTKSFPIHKKREKFIKSVPKIGFKKTQRKYVDYGNVLLFKRKHAKEINAIKDFVKFLIRRK